jgi:hypothetical protein
MNHVKNFRGKAKIIDMLRMLDLKEIQFNILISCHPSCSASTLDWGHSSSLSDAAWKNGCSRGS